MPAGQTAKGKANKDKAPATKEPKKDRGDGEDPEIEALREKLSEKREKLSLLSSPFTVVSLALQYSVSWVAQQAIWLLKQPVLWLLVIPGLVLWFALKLSLAPELFEPPACGFKDGAVLWQVEFAIIEAAWWIILGVLSSIGFGTGLHSGLMFLFPHVMQVVAAAESCHTTTGLVPWYQHPCKLSCATTSGPKDDSTVTFVRLVMLVTVQCMLWGFGTAMGEIPPYAVAKTARSSGKTDSEFQQEVEDAKSKTDPFSRMKIWTISFTEKHGFFGVFLLAAWPNAAFDMCGMCCGYLLMPFWTFFIATACGKGLVKVNFQAAFFVNLFGSNFFNVVATGVDSLNSSLTKMMGKDFALKELLVKGRTKLLQQFQLQSRVPPEKLFEGQEGDLDIADLQNFYSKYDGGDAIAQRVLTEWDKNTNGEITLQELGEAASVTDGMVSLGSLDPGKGTSLAKMAWELFIVGLVLFFLLSAFMQIAKMKQLELDEAELDSARAKKGKAKAGTKKDK